VSGGRWLTPTNRVTGVAQILTQRRWDTTLLFGQPPSTSPAPRCHASCARRLRRVEVDSKLSPSRSVVMNHGVSVDPAERSSCQSIEELSLPSGCGPGATRSPVRNDSNSETIRVGLAPACQTRGLQLGPREARLRLVLRHDGADVEFAVGPTVEAPADARSERIVDGREVGPWRLIHRLIPETSRCVDHLSARL